MNNIFRPSNNELYEEKNLILANTFTSPFGPMLYRGSTVFPLISVSKKIV